MSDPTPAKSSTSVKWWVCGLLLLASTINYMDRQALSQTADEVERYFGLNTIPFNN